MRPASRTDEGAQPFHNQTAKVRRSWKRHASPVIIKNSGPTTVER
jgi:hypothetical protein